MKNKNTVKLSNKRTWRKSHTIVIAALAFVSVFAFGISEAQAENSWQGRRNGYSYQGTKASPQIMQRQINLLRRTLQQDVDRAQAQISILTARLERAQQARRPNRRAIVNINRLIRAQQQFILLKQAQFIRSVNLILSQLQRSVARSNARDRGNGSHSGHYGNHGQNNHNRYYGQSNNYGNNGRNNNRRNNGRRWNNN